MGTCGMQGMSIGVVMNLLRVLARRQVDEQGLGAAGTEKLQVYSTQEKLRSYGYTAPCTASHRPQSQSSQLPSPTLKGEGVYY